MRKLFLTAFIAVLSGCAAPPSAEEFAKADFGPYPEEWKRIITDYSAARLKDPYSAQYNFLNSPTRGFIGLGGAKYGWAVCALINAKNSYGGYTGGKLSFFLIRNNVVIDASMGDNSGYSLAEGKCKGVGIIPR